MSTLIGAYAFNEEACNDYSGNKYNLVNTGVTYSATTSTAWGYDAVFANLSDYFTCTTFPSFNSLTGFTCFFNIYPTNHDYNIVALSGVFTINLSGSNNISFAITDSTSTTHTLTSTGTLTLSTWNTIGCVWDGSYLYIYINGALDSTLSVSFSNIANVTGTTYIKAGAGRLNMFEFRNAAMSANQILSLHDSPGGCQYTVDIHNFCVGDLIADPDVLCQGVITWVIDQSNFVYYPLTATVINPMSRYGNIYNTLRQSMMEIYNDVDGNGNGQIAFKFPIASFGDYVSPINKITLDHNGLTGSTSNIANMMAITSLRI